MSGRVALDWPDPPLLTDRTRLRPWGRPGDPEALVAAWNEPSIANYTQPPADTSVDYASTWIEGVEQRRVGGLAMDFVVTSSSDVAPLGEVGLVVVDGERRWAEIGYWLFPDARGTGRAAEAVDLVAGWALEHVGVTQLFARVPGDNAASRRVVERASFHHRGTADDDIEVWSRTSP